MADTTDLQAAAGRVANYLAKYRQLTNDDPDAVHTIYVGGDPAVLRTADLDALIAAAGVVPRLPAPVDCIDCGMSYADCTSRVIALRRGACCNQCAMTDTHGMREAGVL